MAILQSRPPTSTPQQSARGRGQSATGVHSFRIPPHRSSAGPPPRRSTSSWPPHSSANFPSSTPPIEVIHMLPQLLPPLLSLSGYSMQRSSNFPFPPPFAGSWMEEAAASVRKETASCAVAGLESERGGLSTTACSGSCCCSSQPMRPRGELEERVRPFPFLPHKVPLQCSPWSNTSLLFQTLSLSRAPSERPFFSHIAAHFSDIAFFPSFHHNHFLPPPGAIHEEGCHSGPFFPKELFGLHQLSFNFPFGRLVAIVQ